MCYMPTPFMNQYPTIYPFESSFQSYDSPVPRPKLMRSLSVDGAVKPQMPLSPDNNTHSLSNQGLKTVQLYSRND